METIESDCIEGLFYDALLRTVLGLFCTSNSSFSRKWVLKVSEQFTKRSTSDAQLSWDQKPVVAETEAKLIPQPPVTEKLQLGSRY